MNSAPSYKRNSNHSTFVFILVVIFACLSWGWISLERENPKKSLFKATRLLAHSSSESQEIRKNLKKASKNKNLAPWSYLLDGKILERNGQLQKAITSYQQIPSNSASSLDARTSLMQIAINSASSPNQTKFTEELNKLEKDIETFSRFDLKAKLALIRAMALEKFGEKKSAKTAYLLIRENYPRKKQAIIARERFSKIKTHFSLPEQLKNITLLLKEGAQEQAEQEIIQVKSLTKPNSPARLEVMLVEEQVLRKAGKGALADEVLGLVSAEGRIGTADHALKKMIYNFWNANEHDRALSSISRFMSRFPSSPYKGDVFYAKARILEEKNLLKKAESAYKQAYNSTKDTKQKAKLLRQTAWIQVKQDRKKEAVASFEKLASTLEDKSEYKQDYDHAIFWRAHYKKMLFPEKPMSQKEQTELAGLKGYYKNIYNDSAPAQLATDSNCGAATITKETKEYLSNFAYPGLEPFLRAEIAWFSGNLSKKMPNSIDRSLLKTNLYKHFSLYKESIREASKTDKLLKKEGSKLSTDCQNTLILASYPLGYIDEFKNNAKELKVEPSLLLAIARTESHFDKNALSQRDAKGLLQLIDNTAKLEGLEAEQSLFDPKINIHLGAKHISRLLKKYSGEKVFAIAAYNAGGSAVERWKNRHPKLTQLEWVEQISYPETKNYVKKVISAQQQYKALL